MQVIWDARMDSVNSVVLLFFIRPDGTRVPRDVEIEMVMVVGTVILGTHHLGRNRITSPSITDTPFSFGAKSGSTWLQGVAV